MNFRKTNSNSRQTYTYTFQEKGADGQYYDRKVTLRPGEDGVTEADIALAHSLDDREVRSNIKNCRPKSDEHEKQLKQEYRERYIKRTETDYGFTPYEEEVEMYIDEKFPKNWNVSFDALDDMGIDKDKSPVFEERSRNSQSTIDAYDRVLEIVETLSEEQQMIFNRVLVNEEKPSQVAEDMGISKQAMNDRLKRIKEQIKKKF